MKKRTSGALLGRFVTTSKTVARIAKEIDYVNVATECIGVKSVTGALS